MYAIINKDTQQLIELHKDADDLAQILQVEPLNKIYKIVRVETLDELYDELYF